MCGCIEHRGLLQLLHVAAAAACGILRPQVSHMHNTNKIVNISGA
jgi:hypothetical protein